MGRFSLQRVLELRERKEQAVAIRLAEARAAAEAARTQEAEIEAQRRASEAQQAALSAGKAQVGQIQNSAFLMTHLNLRLESARAAVRSADAAVDVCLADFRAATQDRRVLEKLKERKLEAAAAIEAEQDQKAMDGIALERYVRGEEPSGKLKQ